MTVAMNLGTSTLSADEMMLDTKIYTMQDVESKRYSSFFGTLEQIQPHLIAQNVAVAFFTKSSLGEQEISILYRLIKTLGLESNYHVLNETEFIIAMHFIVCMTKRGLNALPSTFPAYLFPTLQLSHSNTIFTSTTEQTSRSSSYSSETTTQSKSDQSWGQSPPVGIQKLQNTSSLTELLVTEAQNQKIFTNQVISLEPPQAKTLECLQTVFDRILSSIELLGIEMPTSLRTIDEIEQVENTLRQHVQSMKQEIQNRQIEAQMRQVADEVDGPLSPHSLRRKSLEHAKLTGIHTLTQQLVEAQQEAMVLMNKKDSLAKQLLDLQNAKLSTSVNITSPRKESVTTAATVTTADSIPARLWNNDIGEADSATGGTQIQPSQNPVIEMAASTNSRFDGLDSFKIGNSAVLSIDTTTPKSGGFSGFESLAPVAPVASTDELATPMSGGFGSFDDFKIESVAPNAAPALDTSTSKCGGFSGFESMPSVPPVTETATPLSGGFGSFDDFTFESVAPVGRNNESCTPSIDTNIAVTPMSGGFDSTVTPTAELATPMNGGFGSFDDFNFESVAPVTRNSYTAEPMSNGFGEFESSASTTPTVGTATPMTGGFGSFDDFNFDTSTPSAVSASTPQTDESSWGF